MTTKHTETDETVTFTHGDRSTTLSQSTVEAMAANAGRDYKRIGYDGRKVTVVWTETEQGVAVEKKIVSSDAPTTTFVGTLQEFAALAMRELKAAANGEGIAVVGLAFATDDDTGVRTLTVKLRSVAAAADVGITGGTVRRMELEAGRYLEALHTSEPTLFDDPEAER